MKLFKQIIQVSSYLHAQFIWTLNVWYLDYKKKSTSVQSDQMPFCLSQVQSTMENGYLRRLWTLKSRKVNNIPGNNSKVRSSCYRKGENWN